jgi:hypothetical protein
MKCKSCMKDIDAKAKKCPHCQTDQRGWMKRHPILTGIFGLIIFFIVIGIISSSSQSQKVGQNGSATQTSSGSNNQPQNTTYKVGDKIKMGDVILTVNSVETSQGGQYTSPSAGNQWIDVNLTIENTGSSQQFITTLGQMFVLDDKSNQFQVSVTDKAMQNPGTMGLDGAIVAGAKKTGWVGFEVPKTAKGLKLQYNASFYNNQNIVVNLGM